MSTSTSADVPHRPLAAGTRPSAAVVVCAYTEERFEQLLAAVESVRAQLLAGDELIVVIDHNDALADRVRAAAPDVPVVASTGPRGLSGGRNTGVSRTRAEVVAFLDDDARALPGWLDALLEPYADSRVVGTGGLVQPDWAATRPSWFPSEFNWVVGCTFAGLPTDVGPVRNPIGANMSFRRTAFDEVGGFDPAFGFGMDDETQFSIRIRAARPDAVILHVPRARVDHAVTRERATWRYFSERCWREGRTKARMVATVGTRGGLAAERRYLARVLPAGVARGLLDALRGDPGGLARAVAVVAGTALTAAGYVLGRAVRLLEARRG